MEVSHWIAEHWFELLQTIVIVGGLYLTAYTTRKISNLFEVTKQYQQIWKEFSARSELSRVLKPDADIAKAPINDAEGLFVHRLIQHLSTVYRAMKEGMSVPINGLKADISNFFSLPIPRSVWNKSKAFQNDDFVRFVEGCLSKVTEGGLP
jgi:hypothetical protein